MLFKGWTGFNQWKREGTMTVEQKALPPKVGYIEPHARIWVILKNEEKIGTIVSGRSYILFLREITKGYEFVAVEEWFTKVFNKERQKLTAEKNGHDVQQRDTRSKPKNTHRI